MLAATCRWTISDARRASTPAAHPHARAASREECGMRTSSSSHPASMLFSASNSLAASIDMVVCRTGQVCTVCPPHVYCPMPSYSPVPTETCSTH